MDIINNNKRKTVADYEKERESRCFRFWVMERKNKMMKQFESNMKQKIRRKDDKIDLELRLSTPSCLVNTSNCNSKSSVGCNSSVSNTLCSEASTIPPTDALKRRKYTKKRTQTSDALQRGENIVAIEGQIIKKLTESDLNNQQNRLLIEKDKVDYIKCYFDEDEMKKVSEKGLLVKMYDNDTGDEYDDMKFTHWKSTNCFVINGSWYKNFVLKRRLKLKDTVGLRWDDENKRLVFTVFDAAVN